MERRRRELIEEDARGDAEAAIDGRVVEDEGIGAVGDGGNAVAGGAIGRKLLADGDVAGKVVVHAAAYHEVAGIELRQTDEFLSEEGGWDDEGGKRGCDNEPRLQTARSSADQRKCHDVPGNG